MDIIIRFVKSLILDFATEQIGFGKEEQHPRSPCLQFLRLTKDLGFPPLSKPTDLNFP